MKSKFIAVIGAMLVSAAACGQGFLNLDFEQARIQPLDQSGPPWLLDWNLAAPGWSHAVASDTEVVYYGATHVGITPAYLLVDSLCPYWSPLEGSYSLFLQNGSFSYSGGGWVNTFIAQTGTIPAGADFIQLRAEGLFGVYINGAEIPMTLLAGNTYRGDIRAYAGAPAELKILNKARPVPEEVSVPVIVDAITFVPEPASPMLLLLGFVVIRAMGFIRHRSSNS